MCLLLFSPAFLVLASTTQPWIVLRIDTRLLASSLPFACASTASSASKTSRFCSLDNASAARSRAAVNAGASPVAWLAAARPLLTLVLVDTSVSDELYVDLPGTAVAWAGSDDLTSDDLICVARAVSGSSSSSESSELSLLPPTVAAS